MKDFRSRVHLAGAIGLLAVLGRWATTGDGIDMVSAVFGALTAGILLIGGVSNVRERTLYRAVVTILLAVLTATLALREDYVPAVLLGVFALEQAWVTTQAVRDEGPQRSEGSRTEEQRP